ncbi:hypothetical protein HPB52_020719 [Rhipicephalus sanguineus]|uniref:Uncharacterized protein n=1 Tax=Rhipicephalus sanguineus TaxID=34632 RepID=A0A9D4PKY9_RHISA|nr:hypothetical protein HPB52_020719 [Rhipicephalus sanguineus]
MYLRRETMIAYLTRQHSLLRGRWRTLRSDRERFLALRVFD